MRWCVLVVTLMNHYFVSLTATLEKRYSNSFAVGVQGGRDKADEIAAKYGFANVPVSTCISRGH